MPSCVLIKERQREIIDTQGMRMQHDPRSPDWGDGAVNQGMLAATRSWKR